MNVPVHTTAQTTRCVPMHGSVQGQGIGPALPGWHYRTIGGNAAKQLLDSRECKAHRFLSAHDSLYP